MTDQNLAVVVELFHLSKFTKEDTAKFKAILDECTDMEKLALLYLLTYVDTRDDRELFEYFLNDYPAEATWVAETLYRLNGVTLEDEQFYKKSPEAAAKVRDQYEAVADAWRKDWKI
jgi:hypothetical protein